MNKFETSEGTEAAKVGSGEWVQLEGMKLGHGCCDCSLWHQVQFRIVDSHGLEQDEADLHLQMKWVRDQEETERLRKHNTPDEVKQVLPFLINDIEQGPRVATYMGVDVRKMNKDQLLLLVDWLGQELKKCHSRGY